MPPFSANASKHLLVDGTPLRCDSKGVGRYTYHLCCQLDQHLPHDWQITIITFDWPLPQFPLGFRGKFIRISYKSDLVLGLSYFPKLIRKIKPSFFLRCRESIGWQYSVPTITVCHDLNEILWQYQPPRSPLRQIFDHLCQKLRIHALRHSDFVICNSEFVKEQVVQKYEVSLEKIQIGYCGVDPRFYELSPQVDINAVRQKYGGNGFLLAFATGDHRENFMALPSVLSQIKKNGYPGAFVIAGVKQDAHYAQALIQSLASYGLLLNQDYFLEPFLAEERFIDLVNLYTAADFYLELSWHEGFGMQLAEAMACGTTCVSSNRAALAEVGESLVIPVDPSNHCQIAKTIHTAWTNNWHRRDNIQQVQYTRQKFTWEMAGKVVSETIRSYS